MQARGEDDSDPRLTAFVSLTVVVVDPPSLRIRLLSPDFLAPVAQRATLGSLIVEGGFTLTAYNFVANGDDVFVSVDADGLVLLSAAQTGLYLLTLIVADNHPLVDNATLKITARVSPSFELPPPTVIFTITTRAGTSPQRTTLQAVRGKNRRFVIGIDGSDLRRQREWRCHHKKYPAIVRQIRRSPSTKILSPCRNDHH